MSEVIIDVRERDEFEAERIEDSINVPLSHLMSLAPGVLNQLRDRKVIIMCRSGARAASAAELFKKLGYEDKVEFSVYRGGLLEWKKQGRPTLIGKAFHLPIMRQVQLIVGGLTLLTAGLAFAISLKFLWITAFLGAGQLFAGISGICGMANLLALAPWNRSKPGARDELCAVSPNSGCCGK